MPSPSQGDLSGHDIDPRPRHGDIRAHRLWVRVTLSSQRRCHFSYSLGNVISFRAQVLESNRAGLYLGVHIYQLCGLDQINFPERVKQRLYRYLSGPFAGAEETTYVKRWEQLEAVPGGHP